MLGSSLHSPPPPPPPPPDPNQCLKGYRWPASRITKADMMKLTELRSQTGQPITKLIHEAVDAYYRTLVEDYRKPPVSTKEGASQQLTGEA